MTRRDSIVDTTSLLIKITYELPLAKIYEKSSLDHSFFCTFDPHSHAGLLRERIRYDHDHSSASPNATHYGGLLGLSSIAAASLPLFKIALMLVRLKHVAS